MKYTFISHAVRHCVHMIIAISCCHQIPMFKVFFSVHCFLQTMISFFQIICSHELRQKIIFSIVNCVKNFKIINFTSIEIARLERTQNKTNLDTDRNVSIATICPCVRVYLNVYLWQNCLMHIRNNNTIAARGLENKLKIILKKWCVNAFIRVLKCFCWNLGTAFFYAAFNLKNWHFFRAFLGCAQPASRRIRQRWISGNDVGYESIWTCRNLFQRKFSISQSKISMRLYSSSREQSSFQLNIFVKRHHTIEF